ncbi:NADH dehydrogenase [ubiquinone] 1 alpha subcomplex subunit 10, mitochondrial-like [Mya arenaria]|uniref:NADH dehydrogenase [ubiquinone] 1 alpha subcomplex subunit 10, mitochondrial-like n=1 Tax=Mya arenaria TaxID=6604 RepID=UPI0022E0F286|nr:NADH dehydrogenase [ubiquinone] 1 alpha subcomplex subunit 10, mitochondrial-like [Mya arenaria]
MAVARAQLLPLVRACGSVLSRPANFVAPVAVEGQRNLTSNPKYKKPYPSWMPFNFLSSLIDFTSARLNDNSRIIQVDGPPCVGKSLFVDKLAEHFKLRSCHGYQPKDWYMDGDFDTRHLNDFISNPKLKILDVDTFYREETPNLHFSGKQLQVFRQRWYHYADALSHLLSTGIGTVMETSVWSDIVYARTLADMGYFSKKGLQYYEKYRENSCFYLWYPNLIIYLDAPAAWIVAEMKKKNPEYENSPVLNEDYIETLKGNYKKHLLEPMRPYCDVLEYDVTDMEDLDLLFMDLEHMDLISRTLGDYKKFKDWNKTKEEDWSVYRLRLASEVRRKHMTSWRPPFDVDEMYIKEEELIELTALRDMFPELRGNLMCIDKTIDVSPLIPAKGSYLDPAVNK